MLSPSVSVAARGATADHHTLNIPESQVLVLMEGGRYVHHLLLARVRAGVWVTCLPEGTLQVDDMAELEEVIPLPRGGPFPVEGRPYNCHGTHTDGQMAGIRAAASAMAAVFSDAPQNPVPAPGRRAETQWRFADPAHPQFAEAVSQSLLGAAGKLHVDWALGILRMPHPVRDDLPEIATSVENVADSKLAAWLEEKRGGLRDARLTSVRAMPGSRIPLYADAVNKFRALDSGWKPSQLVFDGSASALLDLNDEILKSNMAPTVYAAHIIQSTGISPKSGLVIELQLFCGSNCLHRDSGPPLTWADALEQSKVLAGFQHCERG